MDDLPAVFDLAVGCLGASGWSAADYARACGGDLDGWVAAAGLQAPSGEGERVIGFVISRRMADELEILNLAVEATFRRRRVASRLLETSLQRGRASGGKRAFLEVRA